MFSQLRHLPCDIPSVGSKDSIEGEHEAVGRLFTAKTEHPQGKGNIQLKDYRPKPKSEIVIALTRKDKIEECSDSGIFSWITR